MTKRLELMNTPGGPLREWPLAVGSILRQPILDEFGLRHGYELFLTSCANDPGDGSSDILTILVNVGLFGLGRLTANSRAFVACTGELLTDDLAGLLPPSMTVLEIPAKLEVTPKLLAVCRRLKMTGFRFALVDFIASSQPSPFLELVHYIKMDSGCFDGEIGANHQPSLNGTGPARVATGIHSPASYRRARSEGCKYFQGYYFCRPERVQNARIPADRLLQMEILRELLKEPLQLNTLCPLVKRDPSIVYHVLRQVNSAAYAIREPISSVESALLILGDTAFRRIALLATGCALSSGRSPEILHTAVVRAFFCAGAAHLGNLDPNDQYLLGLLSVLPGLLGVPMELIVPELPLCEKVSRALLGIPVHERCLLDWIECHEANWTSQCRAIAIRYDLDELKLMQAYVEALALDRPELNLVA